MAWSPSFVPTTTPARRYPACPTLDQASIRLSERCPIAPTLPTTIVIVASTASAGPQSSCERPSASSNRRRKIANAAALVATAMNAVIGVGAPS